MSQVGSLGILRDAAAERYAAGMKTVHLPAFCCAYDTQLTQARNCIAFGHRSTTHHFGFEACLSVVIFFLGLQVCAGDDDDGIARSDEGRSEVVCARCRRSQSGAGCWEAVDAAVLTMANSQWQSIRWIHVYVYVPSYLNVVWRIP